MNDAGDSVMQDIYKKRFTIFKPGEPLIFCKKENVIPPIEKIIFNPPATIVFWDDGEKTVVKCKESEKFDYECGLAFAIANRYFGSRSEFKRAIEKTKKVTSGFNSGMKSTGQNAQDFKQQNTIRPIPHDITRAELRLSNEYINERFRKFLFDEV